MLAGSSGWLMIRGVECSVPHVMSCFIALGPSSAGVGDGRLGTRWNPVLLGELG